MEGRALEQQRPKWHLTGTSTQMCPRYYHVLSRVATGSGRIFVVNRSELFVDPAVVRRVLQRERDKAVTMACGVMAEAAFRWCVRAGSALVALTGITVPPEGCRTSPR